MELRLQPKPEVEFLPTDRGIVSRKQFFVKKKFEEINQYFFPAHFVRNWKPKAELIYRPVSDEDAIQYECDFSRDVQNCFVEDYAEEVFLRTPPPCFVVIGKSGSSVSKVSQDIAREYGSVLIRVDDIVNQVIKRQTETSKVLDRILRLGVSLTLNFILALLSYVAHTAEARHRGYVLCGLPSPPLLNDLSVDQQFNYLFTWENKPTVFVNVLFDDEDLIKERTNLRCEIRNVESERFIFFHSEYEEFKADKEETEDDDDESLTTKEETSSYERDLDISPSRPWVQLPRDEESRVWSELELFDNVIRPAIELINSRVDPQYFITVDSRVKNEFDVILARLSLLQIWKAPVAVPLISPDRNKALAENEADDTQKEDAINVKESEDDFYIRQVIEEPPQTAFLTLFARKTISPKFRWELSHYNYICPVSLRLGELLEGKSEFAVTFMKYIYFLRDEESMAKFIQNPRAYVLPIRPMPLCRFIVLGYPLSGKTSLAKDLAAAFSVPLIDLNVILKNDLEQKKNIYQEFCRQKAECREITRLTSQAWKDWRLEEEQRIALIEEWILYIQLLLSQRIEHFYSAGSADLGPAKETQVRSGAPVKSKENVEMGGEDSLEPTKTKGKSDGKKSLEVRGIAIETQEYSPAENQSSPSAKIIQAMRHSDFDFKGKDLEIEANLFFSTLWKSFSNNMQRRHSESEEEEEEEYGEYDFEESEENNIVDWCNLLPPQSLSTLLIKRKICTTREKRQSFKFFLEAASKAYWAPSALKTEFAKWRLPCFMDIPLCEIFLNNPILLLKYLPEWLKERPLIPDPVDPMHPSVLEAGRKAFIRAGVVTVKQNQEEVGILLRDAIEKAEREGMRVTGEVISPGGWVVDNMSLDLDVWNKLACQNVFADHIYILTDSEPDYKRIINLWWETCGLFLASSEYFSGNGKSASEENVKSFTDKHDLRSSREIQNIENSTDNYKKSATGVTNLSRSGVQFLTDNASAAAYDDEQLDAIYDILMNDTAESKYYVPPFPVDPFCHNILQNTIENWCNLRDEMLNEEALLAVQTLTNTSSYTVTASSFFFPQQICPSLYSFHMGRQLETVTSDLLNFFKKKSRKSEAGAACKESLTDGLEFFTFLLTLPEKLEQLKEWLTSLGREATITEVEMTGKSTEEVFFEIKKNLMAPFIKKPRELEIFEIEEIKKSTVRESSRTDVSERELENEAYESEPEEEEDVRIFGESGPLCVVNLERDIFLLGKPEFALRYYGKLYYFWNEDAKNKFIEDPEKYAPYYSAIRSYPPLRVYIMGPVGSGKTSVSESLSNLYSMTAIDYIKFLNKTLIPHSKTICEKFTAMTEQKLLVSEDHNAAAKLAKENFMNAPYSKRQLWLENSYFTDFIDNKSSFEKIINSSQPMASKSYPELTYTNVEAVLEEKLHGDEYLEARPKSGVSLPKTPYVSMKEIENIIINYLENNSDLTDYCVDKSFRNLWTKEPYISQGFIVEGFPFRFHDIKRIIDNNWIPDLVVEISLSENLVIERNIDAIMEQWDTKLKQETVEEKLMEDTLITIQNICASLKRNELIQEKIAEAVKTSKEGLEVEPQEIKKIESEYYKQEESLGKISEDLKVYMAANKSSVKRFENQFVNSGSVLNLPKEVHERIEAEVDEILKDEYPQLVFNPIFETYDAAKARITENLTKTYRRDLEEIEKIKTVLKDLGVAWFEADGMKSLKEILAGLHLKLDKIKKRSGCKGEFSFTIKMDMAEKLLRQGYYFLSKFGKWCPVQVYRMKNPIHMFRPLEARQKITPIAYRNYIYFVAGENEKIKFMEDPIKYIFNEPHHPNIPLRVAVIGPPKSGKTTLSQRLGLMFHLKVVTMGTALRFALEKTPQSTLAKSIKNYLKRGCFLPLSLKVEALMICLNDPLCVTQGFVFDGIPFDAALTQSLAEKGKLPFVIISLIGEADFGKANRQGLNLKEFRLPYKNRTNLDLRYKDWNEKYKRFAQWNQDTYNNLYEVNAKLSVVDIFYQAYDIIRKSFFAILYYVEYCVSDRVLPLQYLCVSQHEYELRKSSFHNNCPVCWVELKKLSSSSDPPPRSGLVQYLSRFYWICPDHMEKFVENPKAYFPPNASTCPKLLPKMLSRSAFEKNSSQLKIHGFGRCPVTRTDFPSSLDWEGSLDFAASYDDEVFLCKNQKLLDRFLAQPWRYCNADTKFEANRPTKSNAVEQLGPPKMTSLPPIGFLEQTVADMIHECLQVLGAVRPIYPNMSPSVTGCIFVALFLKVHNKKNKRPHLERNYLDFMLQHCKAYRYQLSSLKSPRDRQEMGQGDVEFGTRRNESDSSSEEGSDIQQSARVVSDEKNLPTDVFWLDIELKIKKKVWSALNLSDRYTAMKFTSEDELIEIPETPRENTVLKYQTYALRANPIPPISNCLSFIYSIRQNIQIPEEFNCNTLYQPLPLFSPPFVSPIVFNPDKRFALKLYDESQPSFPSSVELRKGKRFHSDTTTEETTPKDLDPHLKLMIERFVPRFQVLDKIFAPKVPSVPRVVDNEPVIFNPHRDYSYVMLFSEFFHTSHVLRCFELNESQQNLEYFNRLDKNLGLSNVRVEFFPQPRKTASMKSSTSLQSYQRTFDAATSFAVRPQAQNFEPTIKSQPKTKNPKSSLINFLHMLLLETLDQAFNLISRSVLSYDAYEINVVPSGSDVTEKSTISIQEILPYPPLPWDIISRPYHAYCSVFSIFQTPPLDNIAHERHVSLLDGITEPNDSIKFVPYPTWVQEKKESFRENASDSFPSKKKAKAARAKQFYFYYDLFNLPWTSFLPYPFSWAYNLDVTDGFSEADGNPASISCFEESKITVK